MSCKLYIVCHIQHQRIHVCHEYYHKHIHVCPTLKYGKKYTLQNTNKPHNHATWHHIKSYPQFQTYPQESVENLENTIFKPYLTTTPCKMHLNPCHTKANAVWVYIWTSLDQRGGRGLPFSTVQSSVPPSLTIYWLYSYY